MKCARFSVQQKARRRGLTLVELLVVLTILAVLMGILAASLGQVRRTARSVVCKTRLQGVAQRFQLFADDYGHTNRGRESERLGPNRFRIEDFQDSLYGTEEFFDRSLLGVGTVPFDTQDQPLICPAGPRGLGRQSTPQPVEDTISPLAGVSIGFNMRLHRASVRVQHGPLQFDTLRDVTLTPRVLEHPWAPLAFDVDGFAARNRPDPVLPFWSAPPVAPAGMYGSGTFWFPAARHGRMVQAAFLGGHVWSSRQPENATDWDWAYQPPPDS